MSCGLPASLDPQATEEISAFICPALVDDHGHAVLRLSMGRLLDTLLANMDDARQQAQVSAALGVPSSRSNSSSSSSSSSGDGHAQQQQQHARRLMMYSGHDSTIMPLLTGEVGCEYWANIFRPLHTLLCLQTPAYTMDVCGACGAVGEYTTYVCVACGALGEEVTRTGLAYTTYSPKRARL